MNNFSLWCDFIENTFLDHEFTTLLTQGINGATSNPSIFKNALLNSNIYKSKIAQHKGKNAKEIYEQIAICDIQKAADKLAFYYHQNLSGFISIEIDPRLYDNTSLSLGEAKRLHTSIARENVMIKIPATQASYEVMYELMKNGIHVNATLVFSLEQSQKCFEALNSGLMEFRKNNSHLKHLNAPQAVISIFVSRFDTMLNEKAKAKNEIGILNANLLYNNIQANSQNNIKALFASTSTKDDKLAKDHYIQELYFPNSINTSSLEAIKAFKRPENFKKPLMNFEIYTRLNEIISQDEREKANKVLLDKGLKQFYLDFEELLSAI